MKTTKSILNISLGLIALLALMAAINNDFSFSAKGFLESLSKIQFKNDWLNALQDLSNSFDKIANMKNPIDLLVGLWSMQWSLIVGVWNFIYNFIYNIIIILKFLFEIGFKV